MSVLSSHCTLCAMQIVPGSGHELRQGHDQLFHKWWNTDTVTYAVTFKTDRGESPRMVRSTLVWRLAILPDPVPPAAMSRKSLTRLSALMWCSRH
jgi:hypothetical protein